MMTSNRNKVDNRKYNGVYKALYTYPQTKAEFIKINFLENGDCIVDNYDKEFIFLGAEYTMFDSNLKSIGFDTKHNNPAPGKWISTSLSFVGFVQQPAYGTNIFETITYLESNGRHFWISSAVKEGSDIEFEFSQYVKIPTPVQLM